MKYLILTLLIVFVTSLISLSLPLVVEAQGPTGATGDAGGGSGGVTKLSNPLGVDDPRIIVGNIIKAILGIVGSLALAVFIFGGLNWVTSAGNEDKIKKGKDMILWATFGLAVIFSSYVLVGFVIDALTGGS